MTLSALAYRGEGQSPTARRPSRRWWGCGLLLLVFLGGVLYWLNDFFNHTNLRAKRDEAPKELAEIRRAEMAYVAEWGQALGFGPCPEGRPGRVQRDLGDECREVAQQLGWRWTDKMRCVYSVEVIGRSNRPGEEPKFRAEARCDINGDLEDSIYWATATDEPSRLTGKWVY